jgi:hypothetical protein
LSTLIAVLVVFDFSANAQDSGTTLMQAMAGATYERRVYDEGGTLRERQVMMLGDLEPDRTDMRFLAVPVEITSYDRDGNVTATTEVLWRCDGDSVAMLMTAAVHARADRDIDVSIDTAGPPILYPDEIRRERKLDDIEFTVRLKSGVLRLLGTRAKLAFTDRVARPGSATSRSRLASAPYSITSSVLLRTLVLGIPVRRIRLESEETVDPEVGLVHHRLTLMDGGVSIAERVSGS